MKNKGLWFQVVAPMTQIPYYGIKLFIVGRIIKFRATEFFTKVGQGLLELSENSSNAYSTGITLYFK